MQEMAKWFTGTNYLGNDSTSSLGDDPNIKEFGSKDGNHIAVLILDQDTVTSGSKPYTLSLENTYAAGANLKIKLNMSLHKSYTDTIKASSTTLLIFDNCGNLSQKYRYEQTDSLNPFKSRPVTNPVTLVSLSSSTGHIC